MNREHLHAEFAGSRDRFRDRVRDVVQLEIEEELCAGRPHSPHDLRPGRGVELQANFEKRDVGAELIQERERFARSRHVQSNNDPFPRIHAVTFVDFMNDENVQVRAPAKINLSLRIVRPREDGFHEIETSIAPISLSDELRIERGDQLEFQCDDQSLPRDANNLVVRAARLFSERTGIRADARIVLRKHIPHGAGLGGGSSDAAATLVALNELFEAPLSPDELARIAAQIGSDVPFFIGTSAAVCRGRGEIVTPAPAPWLRLLLAKPEFGVATADAYARWQTSRALPHVDYAPQHFDDGTFVNDLERPVFEKYPFLARLKSWLREQPEIGAALLSGSGSTVFGALRADADADALARRVRAELDPKLWTCAAETLQSLEGDALSSPNSRR